jgi:hypothetical protein
MRIGLLGMENMAHNKAIEKMLLKHSHGWLELMAMGKRQRSLKFREKNSTSFDNL